MTDTHDLDRFNLFQQIIEWLNSNQQDHHEGRYYLEKHLPLTESLHDQELENLVRRHAAEHLDLAQDLELHLQLLREVHRRGGTRQAIRDAYVNHYGGLALDTPDWLNVMREQIKRLNELNRPERTRKRRIEILREAQQRTMGSTKVRSEIGAELRNELGDLLITGALYPTQALQTKALEECIELHKQTLRTYTCTRYPLQHARTQTLLGNAYLQYGQHGTLKMFEQAINAFEGALRVYTPESHLEKWLNVQTLIGQAFLKRPKGKPAHNIEQAIAYQQAALSHVTAETNRELIALVHVHLGDCYYARLEGIHTENLQLAKDCYRQALHTFTPDDAPEEWAATHIRLAAIFQALPYQSEQQHDRNLHCAIVCYEEALRTYHADVYMIENATTQVSLGYTHKQRLQGDRQRNLQQASRCFRSALRIFTSSAFPAHYRQTLLSLAESERLRKEVIQQDQGNNPLENVLPSPPGLRS
ncbi:hypothetical protein [Ktedonospora formicarum]|uniref:Tetratricopeptide repeat protein n=1 Tax=Ktedonospora formicarum TaxID=2778364 RepID=A0A8J3I1E9_9CHLR|nr:hypothetical protein [Ktedonospora formicarum]GHO44918.1 hypothetical protein KSX_30810 [Ktedonospora formicarum]